LAVLFLNKEVREGDRHQEINPLEELICLSLWARQEFSNPLLEKSKL
jgi:hypothetical protein